MCILRTLIEVHPVWNAVANRWGWMLYLCSGLVSSMLFAAEPTEISKAPFANVLSQAEGGNVKAQIEVGLRLVDGKGVAQDFLKASEWFRKAAMQDDAVGQLELGVMYVNGEGVVRDLKEAYMWYTLSAAKGNPHAREYLKDLDRSLTPEQRTQAKRDAEAMVKQIESSKAPKHGAHRRTPNQTDVPIAPAASPASIQTTKLSTRLSIDPTGTSDQQRYTIWERVRIKDVNGFEAPVEAYSLLVPQGWKLQGEIRWVINTACPSEAVENRVTISSPDNAYRLDVFPIDTWQWVDDPTVRQMVQNTIASGGAGCEVGQPYSASEYLERVFLPKDLPGAHLTSHSRNDPMTKLMLEQAEKDNAAFKASGVQLQSRPSAEIGRLRWADGRIGIAFCAVAQTVSFMPNVLGGGTYSTYQCQATVKTMLSGPAAKEREIEQTLSTIVASTRINPDWQSAVQRVFSNIAKVEQQETAKRAAMWRQTQNEIGEIRRRTWEDTQASRDRIHEEWGRVLRGVDSWTEPGGARVELSAGFSEAWSRSDGTYILSNDPLFDPRVEFKEDWKKLEKNLER